MARFASLRPRLLSFAAVATVLGMSPSAGAADLIVSGNDGKLQRVEGVATYTRPGATDSLAVIDASQFPPRIVSVIAGLEHSVSGPPQAVAITPDGGLAVLGAPSRYDYAAKTELFDTFLQVVDVASAKLLGRVELGAQANGLAISPDGRLLLAACLDGNLRVLTIDGKTVTLTQTIKIDDKRLSGVSFTHDGKSALVARRDTGGLAVLEIAGGVVKLTPDLVSTGVAPYAIDISSDGRWAVVGSVGVGALPGGMAPGDSDIVTLIDVSKRPFRAVQHLTTPSMPEGVALSPDGKWLAVSALNGSNLPATAPGAGRQPKGRLLLFALGPNGATKVSDLPGGEASQGVVFSKDGKTVIVQFNVEKQLALFRIQGGKLVDSGQRLKLDAGPVTIRAMPR